MRWRRYLRQETGQDAIDAWLIERYQLYQVDRLLVRRAVFHGRQVSTPALEPVAHALAAEVLSGGFGDLRMPWLQRWGDLVNGIPMAAFYIVTAVIIGHRYGLAYSALLIVVAALSLALGVRRSRRAPKQLQQTAGQALRLNRAIDPRH